MQVLKRKKADIRVTTDISQNGAEYRVRLFINGNPQCEEDYFTKELEDAIQTADAMREKCIANGAKDATKSTKEEIKAVKESDRIDLMDEEVARSVSDKIYKPILHRFGVWLFETEEYRVYAQHPHLTKELREELWGIRYDLELFEASGLYEHPAVSELWHESPSCVWDTIDEKTDFEDFHGYDKYKARRDAE